jgi:hypothetical protein
VGELLIDLQNKVTGSFSWEFKHQDLPKHPLPKREGFKEVSERDLDRYKVGKANSTELVEGSNFWILQSKKMKPGFGDKNRIGRGFTCTKDLIPWFLKDGFTVQNYNIHGEFEDSSRLVADFIETSDMHPENFGPWWCLLWAMSDNRKYTMAASVLSCKC